MADDIENTSGGDTNPSFGNNDSADQAVSEATSNPSAPAEGADGADLAEPKVVKICKKCMVSQSGVGGFCVNCGSALVPIRAVRDTYVGEVVGGKYEIVSRLGAGGMGEVYLGVNKPLGQQVAVKFLSKKFTADENIILRFLNEARSYCKVTHPNAVTLLEYGQHEDGALYLITEFIDGNSLSDTLKEVGPFGLEQLISISTQICEVLSAAHGQGVIHRDLKPDNIMLMQTSRGRYVVKVLDFGIAKIMDDDHENGAMTETGSVFGTPEFMSPEQACGDETDGRSDLYAVGIILFYLATGKLPFKGKNKLVVLHKQLHEAPPLPSEARDDIAVSAELERVILKCLRKAPGQRFQSADELLGALEAIDLANPHYQTPRRPTRNATQPTNPGDPHDSDAIETVVQSKIAQISNSDNSDNQDISDFFTDRRAADVTELGDFSTENEPSFAGAFPQQGELNENREPESLGAARELSGRWEESDEPLYATSGSRRNLFLGLGLAALLAGGVWYLYANPGSVGFLASNSSDTGADGAVDIDRVLITGQVLGSLAAAQDSVNHADFASAKRSIETTYRWVQDAELPDAARDERRQLSAKVERLIELDTAFSAALSNGDCTRAGRVLKTMAGVETGVERARDDALTGCRSSLKSPAPSTPSPAPGSATNNQPTPDSAPPAPSADTPASAKDTSAVPPATEPSPPAASKPETTNTEPADSTQSPAETDPADTAPATPKEDDSRLDKVMPGTPEPSEPSTPNPSTNNNIDAPGSDDTSQGADGPDATDDTDKSSTPDTPLRNSEDAGFALPPKTIE